MKRRHFIRNLAVASVAIPTGPAARWAETERFPAVGQAGWSGAAFARLQGAFFDVRTSGDIRRLKLAEVSHWRRPKIECASLCFREDRRTRLQEGCYRFFHSALGELEVFVVPGASPGGVNSYRAIFNRLV